MTLRITAEPPLENMQGLNTTTQPTIINTHTHAHTHTMLHNQCMYTCTRSPGVTYQCLVNGGVIGMGVAGVLEEVPEKEHVTRDSLDRFDEEVVQG